MNYPFYGNYQYQPNPYQQQQVMNNPYLNYQQQAQTQMQQQVTTPFVKFVDNVEMVKATDIPMDGNAYYFPKADGTEIYTKQWLSNGQTRILSFKPAIESEQVKQSAFDKTEIDGFKGALQDIQNELKLLTDKVDKLSKPVASRTRKENTVDE